MDFFKTHMDKILWMMVGWGMSMLFYKMF